VNDAAKIGVMIFARNEEKTLPKTLSVLHKQILKPDKIILVNDGSSDKTHDIAIDFGCEVIDLEDDGKLGMGGPKMTRLHEIALSHFDEKYEYILQIDADHIIPSDYLSYLISEMKNNSNLVIAGGLIDGKKSKEPMGSGRLVRYNFHKLVMKDRKVKYGVDVYPIWKARQLGYDFKVFSIDTNLLRKQGIDYKKSNFITVGETYKSLGYHPILAIYIFLQSTIHLKNIKVFFWQLEGYLKNNIEFYDEELRKFVRATQSNLIKNKILKFLGSH
jgi:glycosyltransferase involved in cell wall biosynthesis